MLRSLLFLAGIILLTSLAQAAEPNSLVAWYDHPAKQWVEALPIGNGRLGAMIYGKTADEITQFNEDTLWSGAPHEYQHNGAVKYLPQIRRLLAEGRQKEAESLAGKEFMSVPLHQAGYQAFGDVRLKFPGHETVTNYRRQLDLDSATVTVSYQVGDVTFTREIFASRPDQAIFIHLTASKPGQLNFSATFASPHKRINVTIDHDQDLVLKGQVAQVPDYNGTLRFESRLHVINKGGAVEKRTDDKGVSSVAVHNADAVTLVLVAATSFKNFQDISADPAQRVADYLKAVAGKPLDAIVKAQQADHRRLFRRCTLDLGTTSAAVLPTDRRIKNRDKEKDPQLAALYFQFGRYLLISCSRPGGQPANLQGLWNESLHAPWDSKYTVNINTEMNYWPAEVTNLSECTAPLFDMLDQLVVSGRKTAQEQYGARGWVLHHNTDLWRGTAPINASNHGIWQTGGAWLCLHLWEHYLYTGDKEFLAERAYPVMKEAATFFSDVLVKDPATGFLISTPSNSPEHGGLVAGPTMDHQIIRVLFADTAEAAKTLNVDRDFAAKLTALGARIAPNQIGKHGQLQEWMQDKDDPQDHHRHVSHLWGFFPGNDITIADSKLTAAVKESLRERGDLATGWAIAWRINLWARLRDGDHTYGVIKLLLDSRRTYPNLFDAHPPFQIDGNFGGTAGMAEMLLQSDLGSIDLLPALPAAWPNGNVTGLCARGGFEVDISWAAGKLMAATIRSKLGNPCKVTYAGKTVTLPISASGTRILNGDLAAK